MRRARRLLGWLSIIGVAGVFALARSGIWAVIAVAIMGRVCTDAKALAPRKTPPDAAFFTGLPTVANIAHRGASRLAPEHSLEAYALALRQGAHVLELDLRLTRDRELIVAHDRTLSRTLGLAQAFADLSLDELQRAAGERAPPTLASVFAAFPQARFNLELKDESPAAARALAERLRADGMQRQVLVASRHAAVLAELRRLTSGSVATSASAAEALDYLLCYWMERSCPTAYSALQVPPLGWLGLTSAAFIEGAHRRGLAVHFWTVDEPERMRALLDAGADGIMTNRPDVLAEVLGQRW